MRYLTSALLLLISLTAFSQDDYKIHINDTIFEISVDKEYNIAIDGKEINFKVIAKDTLVHDGGIYSFLYPKDYKVSKLEIQEGIEQIMLMTAEGSGIIIQKYLTINPEMMNALMLREVTKESLGYGYEMNRKDYLRTLKSGQKIEVDKAVLTYNNETNIYEVASIGNKDKGILIMTMVMDENRNELGNKLINLMWDSLVFEE